jgi:hypothetical protein
MSVNIDLELQAGDVLTEINSIGSALKALDMVADDVDIEGKIDDDGITGSIGNVIDRLGDLDAEIDRLSTKLDNELNGVDVSGEHKIVHEHTSPDGDTNSGDSTGGDPPGGGGRNITTENGAALSKPSLEAAEKHDRKTKLTDMVDGLSMRQLLNPDFDIMGGPSRGRLDILNADFASVLRPNGSRENNLNVENLPDNYNRFDREDLENRGWNDLQTLASRENVYKNTDDDKDPGKETLIDRLMSQNFNETQIYDPLTSTDVPESQAEIDAATGRSSSRGYMGLSPLLQDIADSWTQEMYDAFAGKEAEPFNNFNGKDASLLSFNEVEDIASGRSSSSTPLPEGGPRLPATKAELRDKKKSILSARDTLAGAGFSSFRRNLPDKDLREVDASPDNITEAFKSRTGINDADKRMKKLKNTNA